MVFILLKIENATKYVNYELGINYVNSILKDYSPTIKKLISY